MSVEPYTEEDHGHHKGGRSGEPGQTRPVGKRHVPFAALFLVAFAVVPVVETMSWLVYLWDRPTGTLAAWLWMVSGAGIAVVAVAIGLHRRRATLVVWQVAVTSFLWGSASMLTTLAGWSKIWAVVHFFGSLMITLSWALYRIDSFRAAATGQSPDGWGSFVGLARSRPKKVTTTDTHIFAEVEHGPGETHRDVASAHAKLESAIGAVSGGGFVVPGERADTTKLAFEMADAFADWKEWPGPSHPGETFAAPFRTAYYGTGVDQWFSFAATKGFRSPHTDFVSEMDVFVGAAGVTGSGKSGFLNNATAEGLTRVDAIVCWLDREKFLQNAGWAADMLGMGGNEENGRDFNKALRELARYRVQLFGQAALDAIGDAGEAEDVGRKWTPELARQTGEAAVLVVVDEADTSIHTDTWKWLAARARSLGIFLLPATPRVSTAEVPAVVRGSIGAWKTFGIGDGYSQGFTLSQATSDAGADPTKFREPGMHYLDRAPGVNPRMYPVKAREYRSTTRLLRAKVIEARARFNPAVFSRGAIDAMGEHYWNCHPRVVLKLETVESLKDKFRQGLGPEDEDWQPPAEAFAGDPEQTIPMGQVQAYMIAVSTGAVASTEAEVTQARRILAANGINPDGTPTGSAAAQTSRPDRGEDEDRYRDEDDVDGEEEDEMMATATGTDLEADQVATVDHRASGVSDDALERELRRVDPREPISRMHSGEAVAFDAVDPARPRLPARETQDEFDRVIAEFAAAGKMTFTNQEVMESMRCEFSASTCSRRLNGLVDDERIVPPGLKVERTGRTGQWLIVRSRPQPQPRD